jgi:hypothetical protein
MRRLTLLLILLFSVSLVWGQYTGEGTFQQITSLEDLESGTYYVFYGISGTYNGAMTNSFAASGRLANTSVTITGAGIIDPSASIVWYVEGNAVDGYTVYNEDADVFCEITESSTSGFRLNNPSTHTFDVSLNTDEFVFASNHEDGGNRAISIYQTDWRSYANPNTLHLYKFTEIEDPLLIVTPTSLSGLDYTINEGPSDSQTFTLSGSNLDGTDLTITAPSNFEISEDNNSFSDAITLSAYDGSAQDIHVSLKADLPIGDYSGNVAISGGGAETINVAVSGSVTYNWHHIEAFDNYPETGTSYNSGNFLGQDGSTWTYVKCAGASGGHIDPPTPYLGKDRDPQSEIYSGTISGGIGILNFDYKQVFSTNVNLNVMINDVVVGNVTSNNQQGEVLNSGNITVEVEGDFVIKFINENNSDGQVAIDNVSWTMFEEPTSAATVNIPTGNDIDEIFTGTNVSLAFDNVSTGGDITVNYYSSPPNNASFSGSAPQNISSYRWTIDSGPVVFSNGTIKISTNELDGIGNPETVDIYRRPVSGIGVFSKLTTVYSDGTLSASVTDFSEFILASDDGDNPLPVTLNWFKAGYEDNQAILSWQTASETNNLGWNLYRADDSDEPEMQINGYLIEGGGTTSQTMNYSFTDEYPVTPGNTYYYWLESVELDGTIELFGPASLQVPIEGEVPSLPDKTKLRANFPNPFNPDTYISFDIRAGETGLLQIYDLRGRMLENREFSAGSHNFHWQPERQASGIYLYRLQTESYTETKKMLLLK